MTIWLVVPDYGYEGWGRPEGAYTSKDAAEMVAAQRGGCEIFVLTLDAKPASAKTLDETRS